MRFFSPRVCASPHELRAAHPSTDVARARAHRFAAGAKRTTGPDEHQKKKSRRQLPGGGIRLIE
jgi:hypothetical protein